MKIFFLIILSFVTYYVDGQNQTQWQLLDPDSDNVLGISAKQGLQSLEGRNKHPVIVAVIDNGADFSHFDLANCLWINEREIPDNGIDDDGNGYVDDLHGWNFLGNDKGENLKDETVELTRCYLYYEKKFNEQKQSGNSENNETASRYWFYKAEFDRAIAIRKNNIEQLTALAIQFKKADSTLTSFFQKANYSDTDLIYLQSKDKKLIEARDKMLFFFSKQWTIKEIENAINTTEKELSTRYNPYFEARKTIVGDNTDDINDSQYGNPQIDARGPVHGTGVSSVITALDNDSGSVGVFPEVKIMVLRIVPNGDERDKDILLAFRYAIENGADIINCSFGRFFSLHPEFLELAIKESEAADVLVVHGAGNESNDNDLRRFFPDGIYSSGTRANNWINVGASGSIDDEYLLATFSHFGKKTVDILAPGIRIKTCTLNNKFEWSSGTSIAAPIVSGVAAILKAYFPNFSAAEIKDIIIKSAYIPKTTSVIQPGTKSTKMSLSSACLSGGIVNLNKAVKLAEQREKNRKQ